MGKPQLYRIKIRVEPHPADKNVDSMTVRSAMNPDDLKHAIKRILGDALDFERDQLRTPVSPAGCGVGGA